MQQQQQHQQANDDQKKPRSKFPVSRSFRTAFLFRSRENKAGSNRGKEEEKEEVDRGRSRAAAWGGRKRRIVSLVPSPGGSNHFCLVEGGEGGVEAESAGEIP